MHSRGHSAAARALAAMELGLGEPSTSVTVDEALTGTIGEFGRGQRLMYTVVCSAWIASGLLTMVRQPFVHLCPHEAAFDPQ